MGTLKRPCVPKSIGALTATQDMTRRRRLLVLLLVMCCPRLGLATDDATGDAAQPNVLLVLADDLPRNALGAYGAEHGLTPTMDALARAGATFSRAYTTSPLCTPSRYSLFTGRYSSTAGGQVGGPARGLPAAATGTASIPEVWQRGVRQVAFQTYLSKKDNVSTMAHVFRRAGYWTGFVGKYHFGHPLHPADCGHPAAATAPAAPARRLDEAVSEATRAMACVTIGNQSCLHTHLQRHAGFDFTADVYFDNDALSLYAHEPEWMALEALRFVRVARQRRATGKLVTPFFLMMAPTLTHAPSDVAGQLLAAPREGPAGCAAQPTPRVPQNYSSRVTKARRDLVKRLQQARLLCGTGAKLAICPDETLPAVGSMFQLEPWLPAAWFSGAERAARSWRSSVATSVAHAAWLDASLAPLIQELREQGVLENTLTILTADHGPFFAGKGHPYEAGVRVPLIMHWPAGLGQPGTINARVAQLDLLPSLAQLVGRPVVDSAHGKAWPWLGRDVVSRSRGQPEEPLLIEVGYSRAVVADDWKLILVLHNEPPASQRGLQNTCRTMQGTPLPPATTDQLNANRSRVRAKLLYDGLARHPEHYCSVEQLYDLRNDPAEVTNIAAAQPEKLAALKGLLLAHVAHVERAAAPSRGYSTTMYPGRRAQRRLQSPAAPTPAASRANKGFAEKRHPSWCQTCHPSTLCPVWPAEDAIAGVSQPRPRSPLPFSSEAVSMIKRRVNALLDEMEGAINPSAVLAAARSQNVREKCVMLRAEAGRLLIDFLGSRFDQRNFSFASCFPAKHENYLQSRLHVAIRLILRVLRRFPALPTFEIGLCPDDCPPALGGPSGMRPLLTSVSCQRHRSLPFISWIVNIERATDLSEWDEAMVAQWEPRIDWQDRIAKGVFRGHLRQYSYCGGWPDSDPRYREPVTAANWRTLGRAAIWAKRIEHPELLNANFGNHAEMARTWGLSAAEAEARDEPNSISMLDQARQFRYLVHAEGQCGSADRLKQSLASPMLLLKQGSPCHEWFEPFFEPWVHYVPLDGNFSNLTAGVVWARTNNEKAKRMVANANARIQQVVSVAGLYEYSERLVTGYAERFANAARSEADVRAREVKSDSSRFSHEFACAFVSNGKHTQCTLTPRH